VVDGSVMRPRGQGHHFAVATVHVDDQAVVQGSPLPQLLRSLHLGGLQLREGLQHAAAQQLRAPGSQRLGPVAVEACAAQQRMGVGSLHDFRE
jgi:hypothetical protein